MDDILVEFARIIIPKWERALEMMGEAHIQVKPYNNVNLYM